MLNQIAQLVFWLFRKVLERLPYHSAARVLNDMIYHYAEQQSPRDALCFLFEIDNEMYSLEGGYSVAYGQGVHSKHRHMRYHDFFSNRIHASEKVLDIGCGIGAVAYDIAQKSGCNVVAIDLEDQKIAEARKLYSHARIEYIVGDALNDLPGGDFDVVVLSNVLEHLPGRSEFLKRVGEVTGSKRLLIRVPLFERDWRVPLKKEIGVEWRLDKTHETEYTLEGFLDEITKAGMVMYHQEVRWGEIWAEVRPDDT